MNVALPTDDPELLEQIDSNLEDADAPASLVHASASRSFQDASELLSRVKSATGYFPVVGIGASDGLGHPSTDRKPAKSGDEGKKSEIKEILLSTKVRSLQTLVHFGVWPRAPTSRSEPRPPMSEKRPTETGTTRGGPHHILGFVRISECMLCREVGYHAWECPNETTTMSFSPGKRTFGTCALIRALLKCHVAILDGGATKTVSGFTSVQPVVGQIRTDQH